MHSATEQRLLVISPVRNEVDHIELVAHAMAAQTRPPDAWVVVDDGSTDGTPDLLKKLEQEIDFMTVVVSSPELTEAVETKDRLAMAAAPRTFNRGLHSVDWRSFTHVSKLDGDTELPPEYFQTLMARFAADPTLGLAGGVRKELAGDDDWRLERPPTEYHVPGALKLYSLECFDAIGGMHERLGWDSIDEIYARLRGYRTRAYTDLVAVHHRPWGSADGSLRGRARHGRCAYIVRYPLPWVVARAPKSSASQAVRPVWLSALFYVGGYIAAAVRRVPRVDDPQYRVFMRQEIAARAMESFGVRGLAARLKPVPVTGPLAADRQS